MKAFVSGRLSYDALVHGLKEVFHRSGSHAADVHATLGEAVESGRLPNDLAQIIRTQLPPGGGSNDSDGPAVPSATAAIASGAAEPAAEDDLDEPTIPNGVVGRTPSAAQSKPPGQSPYLPPLPYLTEPPAQAGDDMRNKVDDVVLGSIVDGFKDFRKARTSGGDQTAAEAQSGKLDQFLTGYKSARLRTNARKAAAGQSGGAADLNSLAGAGAERAGVGTLLRDRFVLDREVGRGAMGVVYAAVDRRRLEAGHDEPYVALKLLTDEIRSDTGALRQLEAEARKAQALAHPNIATIYDFDRDGGEVFIVMELLRGTTLDRKLSAALGHSLPAKEALPILQGICDGLIYAHSQNVVHSDLKPGNIFVLDNNVVKLLDFGLAAVTTADITENGLGSALTASYASPEMFQKAPRDPRDDVFALGCIAYQVLAGRHPFSLKGSDQAARENMVPEPLEGLDADVWQALEKALAFKREDRLADVSTFRAALFD